MISRYHPIGLGPKYLGYRHAVELGSGSRLLFISSSVAVNESPRMKAASNVARAVSPTSAATSTRFAVATLTNSIASKPGPSSKDSSACAEPFEQDNLHH